MTQRLRTVAVHDVEPHSFRRCTQIRDWLAARGVASATLLVIPARGLQPFARRSPALSDWLHERVAAGDAVAQHGLLHDRGCRRCALPRELLARFQGGPAAEFAGLGERSARARLHAGRAMMLEAGLEPRGFVAPGYAYSPALRAQLAREFDWYADLTRVFTREGRVHHAPAFCLGTTGRLRRPLSPLAARGMSALARSIVRIDVHPEDFDHRGHRRALAAVLDRTADLPTVVYDELVAR